MRKSKRKKYNNSFSKQNSHTCRNKKRKNIKSSLKKKFKGGSAWSWVPSSQEVVETAGSKASQSFSDAIYDFAAPICYDGLCWVKNKAGKLIGYDKDKVARQEEAKRYANEEARKKKENAERRKRLELENERHRFESGDRNYTKRSRSREKNYTYISNADKQAYNNYAQAYY